MDVFGVKVENVKLIGLRWFLAAMSSLYVCPNHTYDDIHSDDYLDIWEIPGGPP